MVFSSSSYGVNFEMRKVPVCANYYDAQKSCALFSEDNGEYGEDWPLRDSEISILTTNQESLVDLLELIDLLRLLYSSNVINKRQRESISSKQTSHEKNEALLDILRRRSIHDYNITIKQLHHTKQSHIAKLFERGGGRNCTLNSNIVMRVGFSKMVS